MKKIAVFIICLLIGFMQITYAAEIYTDYDFSDEAQEEFNRRRKFLLILSLTMIFKYRKKKQTAKMLTTILCKPKLTDRIIFYLKFKVHGRKLKIGLRYLQAK